MTMDVRILGIFSKELRNISSGFAEIKITVNGNSSDDITEAQFDKIESLLFRYRICRRASLIKSGFYLSLTLTSHLRLVATQHQAVEGICRKVC